LIFEHQRHSVSSKTPPLILTHNIENRYLIPFPIKTMDLAMKLIIFSAVTTLCLHESRGFSPSKIYPRRHPLLSNGGKTSGEDGDPLFLTPFIKAGKLEEGKALARVNNVSDVVSYSGYLTVNPKYNSNVFFWFFPAAVSCHFVKK